MITIYHNPRCAKSRDCLVNLELSNKEFKIVKYLETVPTYEELSDIIQKLGIKPIELVRQKEAIWIEKFKNKPMTDKQLIQAMIDNPILIERPIVVNGNKAVIARPLEKANDII
jgi:arsenate reductase